MMTNKYKKLYETFKILSWSVTILPLVVYFVIAFSKAEIVHKLAIGSMLTIVLILTVINVIGKLQLRSPLFLLLIGIYVGLGQILTPLVITTCGVVLDEFIFTPLYKKYKQLYVINKEIDKRNGTD